MRFRPAAALVSLAAVSAFGLAQARTVEIVRADRLELRKVDNQDLVVISGSIVELHLDQDVIKARRVEFNRTKRLLTLVGTGSYLSHPTGPDGNPTEQLVTGQNIVVDLGSENLAGEDVIVSTANLEIRGDVVERVPGQLTVNSGYFTPCAKCGRTPNDYAFRARDIRLYPGDRLVAFDATLLLADAPVAFIPAIVLFLREKDRQPQLSIAQDSTDGFVAKASLPFVIGASTFGNTLVHFYENREAHFGLGVNLTSYQTFPTLDKLNLYAIAEPRTVGNATDLAYDYDLRLTAVGKVPVRGSVNGLNYSVNATRNDTGSASTDKGVTVVDAKADVDLVNFSVAAEYLDRYGPPPSGPLYTPLKRPEVIIDPDPYVLGNLSGDFRVTAGNYRGAVNPASRSANALADETGNITANRLQENHLITYTVQPWSGANFTVSNSFTGNYYSTGARVVDLKFGARLDQAFGQASSASLDYLYTRQEGIGPFQFEPGFPRRNISGVLTGSTTLVPFTGLSLTASQPYDFVKPGSEQQPATFGLTFNRDPFNLNLSYRPNFFTGLAESGSGSLGLGNSGSGPYFSASTTYDKSLGFSPLVLGLSYADALRTNSVGVGTAYNFQYGAWDYFSFNIAAVANRDPVLNPVTFNLRQQINYGFPFRSFQYPQRVPSLVGNLDLTWRDLYFNESHTLVLGQLDSYDGTPTTEQVGTAFFKLSNVQGGPVNWSLTYGGPYSSQRGGWTAPTLVGRYQITRNLQSFGADATVSMPGLQQPITELTGANLTTSYQFSPRVALGGAAHYTRSRVGDLTTDTLNFDNLALTFGLGRNERPDVYVSTALRQTFSWQNGLALQPQPVKPIVKITVDRCCWALNFEFNPLDQYVRFSLNFPGSTFTPGLNVNEAGPTLNGISPLP